MSSFLNVNSAELASQAAGTYRAAVRAASSTWPFALGVLALVILLMAQPDLPAWFSLLVGFVGFALWSSQIYRALATESLSQTWVRHWARFIGVHALLMVFFGFVVFFLGLFLMIFSVILVAVSGYDPSAAEATDVDASLAALRESGAIWLLYGLVGAAFASLFWFVLRLTLTGPETARQEHTRIFRTWRRTRGYVAQILLLALITLALPVLIAVLGAAFVPPTFAPIIAALLWTPPIYVLHGLCATLDVTLPIPAEPPE